MAIVLDGTSGITAPAVDATLDGADLTSGSVTQAKLATLVVPIGVGQTWQDVTASRAWGTTYTNTTGRPITVSIVIGNNGVGGNPTSYLRVGGVDVAALSFNAGSYDVNTVIAIVPSGATYSAVRGGSHVFYIWAELR